MCVCVLPWKASWGAEAISPEDKFAQARVSGVASLPSFLPGLATC